MRNPNGYGTVAKLSGNRRRPYIVKKVSGWKDNGQPIYDIIGYAETREAGNILLAQYNHEPWDVDKIKMTLDELFQLWKETKALKLKRASQRSLFSAYKHCVKLSHMTYKQIKAYQMQDTIDNCGLSYSTQAAIKALWGHLDKFALELDISSKNFASLLVCESVPETNRKPFSDEEVNTVWEHQDEPWVDTILILLYSGWRISELFNLKPSDIDLDAGTMTGGPKTEAGKNRIVPIHPKIRPFIEKRLSEGGVRLIMDNGKAVSMSQYRKYWTTMMERFEMKHTPHECRHTFRTRLDSAGANTKCMDLLMGHTSKDTGNRVYTHKTVNELKATIELIKN